VDQFLEDGHSACRIGAEALAMVRENLGASERVVDAIIRHLPAEEEKNHG
jgi:hypothetical protein